MKKERRCVCGGLESYHFEEIKNAQTLKLCCCRLLCKCKEFKPRKKYTRRP